MTLERVIPTNHSSIARLPSTYPLICSGNTQPREEKRQYVAAARMKLYRSLVSIQPNPATQTGPNPKPQPGGDCGDTGHNSEHAVNRPLALDEWPHSHDQRQRPDEQAGRDRVPAAKSD